MKAGSDPLSLSSLPYPFCPMLSALQEESGQNKIFFPAPYTLNLLRAAMLPREKSRRKPAMARRDAQGKQSPRAAARRQMLQWVSGRRYKAVLRAIGTWLKEKNVPPRKVMGSSIKLLNVAISSWVPANRAAKTPKKENNKQVKIRLRANSRLISSLGAMSIATRRKAIELTRPL